MTFINCVNKIVYSLSLPINASDVCQKLFLISLHGIGPWCRSCFLFGVFIFLNQLKCMTDILGEHDLKGHKGVGQPHRRSHEGVGAINNIQAERKPFVPFREGFHIQLPGFTAPSPK